MRFNFILILFCCFAIFFTKCDNQHTDLNSKDQSETNKISESNKIQDLKSDVQLKVNKIIIVRNNKNNFLTEDAIRGSIPYKENSLFKQNQLSLIIKNLYALGKQFSFFDQIQVFGELLDDNLINLYIVTYEKPEFKEVLLEGNRAISKNDIEKKAFNFAEIHAINEDDLQKIVQEIKRLYKEKDYHFVEINTKLKVEDNKATVIISIQENKRSLVKRVFFKGNKNISSKRLSNIIFTRENWLFGFLVKAGSYKKENLEMDTRIIENYYKSNGYFMAKVIGTDVKMDKNNQYFVTFTIEEGDLYRFKEVKAEGNDLVSEEILLSIIPIRPGNIYSAKDIRDSIEILRTLWGQYGYIFADIEPIIIPDEKNKTVDVLFNSELGNKVFVNRINILGNKKTNEKVIRRRILIDEGDLLTTAKMDESKDRVELLGYFAPQNGANWKINRLDDQLVDLDLIVNEVKTGKFTANMGVGGSPKNIQSIAQSFKFSFNISDVNLFGEGIQGAVGGSWSKEEWNVNFNLTNPYLIDRPNRPVYGEIDLFVTKSEYGEELNNISNFNERVIGAFLGVGFTTSRHSWFNETAFTFKLGVEDLRNNKKNLILSTAQEGVDVLRSIFFERFEDGTMTILHAKMGQDVRNNFMNPSRGYHWTLFSKLGLNTGRGDLGFAKLEGDIRWYTPLIGENKLILATRAFFGIVGNLGDSIIPYRELYHIGGPASVRGFLFGQIGPSILGDSIGAKKAFFVNAELIFPISQDNLMKGAFFYDGGAGWDTPGFRNINESQRKFIKNNNFEFRHAIGFGVRMLKPTPIKIDLGFKLDKKKHEKQLELHLSAYRDF